MTTATLDVGLSRIEQAMARLAREREGAELLKKVVHEDVMVRAVHAAPILQAYAAPLPVPLAAPTCVVEEKAYPVHTLPTPKSDGFPRRKFTRDIRVGDRRSERVSVLEAGLVLQGVDEGLPMGDRLPRAFDVYRVIPLSMTALQDLWYDHKSRGVESALSKVGGDIQRIYFVGDLYTTSMSDAWFVGCLVRYKKGGWKRTMTRLPKRWKPSYVCALMKDA